MTKRPTKGAKTTRALPKLSSVRAKDRAHLARKLEQRKRTDIAQTALENARELASHVAKPNAPPAPERPKRRATPKRSKE